MYKIDTEIVCFSKLDDETLILNLDTGFYYTLDHVGAFIWERLLNRQSEAQIITAIVDEYHVTQKAAEKDFQELLTMLEKEGLIQKIKRNTMPQEEKIMKNLSGSIKEKKTYLKPSLKKYERLYEMGMGS